MEKDEKAVLDRMTDRQRQISFIREEIILKTQSACNLAYFNFFKKEEFLKMAELVWDDCEKIFQKDLDILNKVNEPTKEESNG